MFRFIKKSVFYRISIFIHFKKVNFLSAALLSCISMNNQECEVRPEIVNANSDEPVFFSF